MNVTGNKYIVAGIFIFALAVRVFFAVKSADVLNGDAIRYDALAVSLAEGRGYVDEAGNPCSHYPPFYPFFLGAVYSLFGHAFAVVRIIQSAIGAVICVLIWFIAKMLINTRAGIIAALFSTIYPPFIKMSELLMTELLFTFLLLLITVWMLTWPVRGKIIYAALAGILLGMASLTRAAMLFYIFFIFPVFLWSNRKRRFTAPIKQFLLLSLFYTATLAPWTIRNYVVYHKFVPIATQGGITFYSSYCLPGGVFGKLADDRDPVVVEANKISSPAERSSLLFSKGIEFIKQNPAKFFSLQFQKILYFWAPFDWEIIGDKWFNILYVLMAPFFIGGFFLAFKEFRKFYPILLPILYFQIVSLVFYGSPRFRLPVEPFLFILSAMYILKYYGYLKTRYS